MSSLKHVTGRLDKSSMDTFESTHEQAHEDAQLARQPNESGGGMALASSFQVIDISVDTASARRKQAAEDEAISPEHLSRLLVDGNFWVRQQAHQHPDRPDDLMDLISRAKADARLSDLEQRTLLNLEGEYGLELLVQNDWTMTSILEEIFKAIEREGQGSTFLKLSLARHPNSSEDLLMRLSMDVSPRVRKLACEHAHAPDEIQDMLNELLAPKAGLVVNIQRWKKWRELGPYARELMARHPEAPDDILKALLNDRNHAVRLVAAAHPNLSADQLKDLVTRAVITQDERCLIAIAKNASATDEILELLLEAGHLEVKQLAAQHVNCGERTLKRLVCDGNCLVREQALRHPAFSPELLQELVRAGSSPDLMRFTEYDTRLETQVLEALAARGLWGERLAARHPNTPASLVRRFCTHRDPLIRHSASQHVQLDQNWHKRFCDLGTTKDLQELSAANSEVQVVLDEAFCGELLTMGVWAKQVLAQHPMMDQKPAYLAKLLGEEASVRMLLAENHSIAVDKLVPLLGDETPDIRWAMVRRPDLSESMLLHFKMDLIPAIREVAEARLAAL